MAQDLGTGVSYVYDEQGYGYDMVVFQKGKPPLDSELNLCQQLSELSRQRQMLSLPSGWVSFYPFYTDSSLSNSFYTQNPTNAKPEYALVNGFVIPVTNTATQLDNANLIELGRPPSAGNVVNGIFLEVWRALLAPNSTTNKPDPATIIDSLNCINMIDSNNGAICGDNGLILTTQNGGKSWSIQLIDTKRKLNGISFATASIGWVVGSNGVIARTSSRGQSWTLLASNTTEELTSVYAVDQLTAWAVGTSGTILKTVNGVTWVPLVSGITSNLKKVYFYDNLVGWAIGAFGTILKTTNGGTSWVRQTSNTTQNLNSVFFYDLNYGFAVGDGGVILRSSDGGASWVSQSNNIYTGSGYTSTTENLFDVNMAPTLDHEEINEEVSSQMSATSTSFTVYHKPITKGDGNGTITNDPADVSVTVNGQPALVNSVNGTTGAVLLNSPVGNNAVVKVTYFYRGDSAVFEGKAWITGSHGSIFYTDTIGAQWIQQNSGTSYDLYSVSFIDQSLGWVTGASSIIKNTTNGGTSWNQQQSDVFVRQIQRIYYEGNTKSKLYLNDNSIHPDVNIETTKRVQIQYKIRVITGADPSSNPEAGLSSGIMGEGPNASGVYPYENMGVINGDYGCWRAKCPNTVDDYVYAIPMFFVNRRNTASYNPQSNANGSHQKNSANVRPDLLYATNVIDSDILDVRRRVLISSETLLLNRYFDILCANQLKTNFYRASEGGDRYGTALLQVDRVGGTSSNGGTEIAGIDLNQVVAGELTSESTIATLSSSVTATLVKPTQYTIPTSGIFGFFSSNPSRYSATYVATSSLNGTAVPGHFIGLGTSSVIFIFDSSVKTTADDSSLASYDFLTDFVSTSSTALTHIPTEPKLVKNLSGLGSPAFFYQGVLNTTDSRTIESWDSGIPGYTNYSLAYQSKDVTNTEQLSRASSVEVHFYVTVTATGATLVLPITVFPDTQNVPYSIYTVRKINNVTAGFSHRISNMVVDSTTGITVTAAAGFEFIIGTVLEIVAMAESGTSDSNVRNGATVNFIPEVKKIERFTKSGIFSQTVTIDQEAAITVSNAVILGYSTTDTVTSLGQAICWQTTGSITTMRSVSISFTASNIIRIQSPDIHIGDIVTIQLLLRETQLTYPDVTTNNDGLLISYNYVPPQCQNNLPSTLIVDMASLAYMMYVSDLGTGGGTQGSPYLTPLEHIPVNDVTISSDNIFNNKEPMQFANFSTDTGFMQMPVYAIGSFSGSLKLSTPSVDLTGRSFYAQCSRQMTFIAEGLQFTVGRKIYLPVLAQVNDPTNTAFMSGEYVIVIFSRSTITDRENKTGFFSGGACSVSVYRLPNRPISKV